MAKTAAARGPHLYDSWPHPKPPLDDRVDPRLVEVVRQVLPSALGEDDPAECIAEQVWAWLAEGDG